MRRSRRDFAQFGITVDADVFTDAIVDTFNDMVRGQYSVDELLLHPRDALALCETIR
jgi:hypothetical protein